MCGPRGTGCWMTDDMGGLAKDRADPSGLLRVASHIWKTSPPTIRVGLLHGHDASVSLRPDASHYRNRESLVRRQAAERHLEDGGIYRMRWWATVDCRQNHLRDQYGDCEPTNTLGSSVETDPRSARWPRILILRASDAASCADANTADPMRKRVSWPGCSQLSLESHLPKNPCVAFWERCSRGCGRNRARRT